MPIAIPNHFIHSFSTSSKNGNRKGVVSVLNAPSLPQGQNNEVATSAKIKAVLQGALGGALTVAGTGLTYGFLKHTLGGGLDGPSFDAILGHAMVWGSYLGAYKKYRDVTAIQSNSPSESSPTYKERSTLSKVAQAALDGWVAYAIIFSTSIFGSVFLNRRAISDKAVAFEMCMASLVGLSQGAGTYKALSIKPESKASASVSPEVSQAKRPPSQLEGKRKFSDAEIAKQTMLAAVKAAFGTIGTIFTYAVTTKVINGQDLPDDFLFICGDGILWSGLLAGRSKRLELIAFNSGDPNQPRPPKSTAAKVIEAAKEGWIAYGITGCAAFLGLHVADKLGHDISKNELICGLLGLPAVVGLVQAVRTYRAPERHLDGATSKKPPTLAEQWKSLPKAQKQRVATVSLLALMTLGILYVGPGQVVKTLYNCGAQLYNTAMYSVKSKTETKTLKEWYAGYSNKKEMERIDKLPLAATCAEILNTCDIDPTEIKKHKKVLQEKYKRFHPDKNSQYSKDESSLVTRVIETLGRASFFLDDHVTDPTLCTRCEGPAKTQCEKTYAKCEITCKATAKKCEKTFQTHLNFCKQQCKKPTCPEQCEEDFGFDTCQKNTLACEEKCSDVNDQCQGTAKQQCLDTEPGCAKTKAECSNEGIICYVYDEPFTITKELTTPHWLLQKFGVKSVCEETIDGKSEIVALEECNHL